MERDPSLPADQLEVFADISCPFAYVGLRRLASFRDSVGSPTRLRVRAWPLELVNGAPMQGEAVAHKVDDLRTQVVPDLFVGFDPTTFPATTLPALDLVEAAYEHDVERGEAMSLAVRDALFEHGHDVSDQLVLARLAERLGTPLAAARHRETVLASWDEGQRRGVVGSPHFFTRTGGFFCPVLDISHEQDHLRIRFDSDTFDSFVTACFTNGD